MTAAGDRPQTGGRAAVPGVSYVLTVYNKAGYVEESIGSVLDQIGEFPKEVVVVDDGSSDSSLESIETFLDDVPGAKIITQENAGPARALNVGVSAASHPFILFLDGDDRLVPDATLRLLSEITDERVAFVMAMGKIYERHRDELGGGDRARIDNPLELIVRTSLAGCSGVLVRRDAFLEVGGCDETVFIQDQSYVRRLAVKNSFVLTADQLRIRHEQDQPGLSDNPAQIEHDRTAAFRGFIRDYPDTPVKIKRMIFMKAAKRAWRWVRRHEMKKPLLCWEFWLVALSYLPWLPNYERLLELTCGTYRETGRVRIPDIPASPTS